MNELKVPPIREITRIQAMDMYVESELRVHPNVIARKFKVPNATIQEWMREDEWVANRQAKQRNRILTKIERLGLESEGQNPETAYKNITALHMHLQILQQKNMQQPSVLNIIQYANAWKTLSDMEEKLSKRVGIRDK